jgi:D-aminopeptidase
MKRVLRLGSRISILPLTLVLASASPAAEPRPRARDIGIAPGVLRPGPLNAITDVAGVRVGHTTIIEGTNVRTGVTAILPHGGNAFQEKVAGAIFVGNGFGKLAGYTQVRELGTIETPVVLTNTLAVGAAMEALVSWTLAQPGNENVRSVNAVVGETNDGWALNDIRSLPVRREHVLSAIAAAKSGPVDEGSVGAGTGTVAFGWKGGIGTSSRVLPAHLGGYTLGVLVQTNYGGLLTLDGVPLWRDLGKNLDFGLDPQGPKGSCMIVVATDAPLDARDLERLAARAVMGLARTGSSFGNGSGDYSIAFSTSSRMRTLHGSTEARAQGALPPEATSPLFQAVLEATEEAVANSLLRATTVAGHERTVEAVPIEKVREILRRYKSH